MNGNQSMNDAIRRAAGKPVTEAVQRSESDETGTNDHQGAEWLRAAIAGHRARKAAAFPFVKANHP